MSKNDNESRGTIYDKIHNERPTLSSLSEQQKQSEESNNSETATSKSYWTKPPPPTLSSSSGVERSINTGPGYSRSSLYSSVKRLNLFPKRLAGNDSDVIYNSNSFKRFRANNNNIENLTDSIHEPSIRSRVSHVSTPSSTSSVALGYLTSEFGRKQYPKAPLSITGRDSPSLIMNNLNLSSSISNSGRNAMTMNQNRKSTDSYFYTGKTTFGGSNLRKNIHRLSMTPYSPYARVNVKCIEPMVIQRPPSTSGKNISQSTVDEDIPLSSVTQRILDRLDKAAAPISDAKSRISLSTLINNSAKKFNTNRTPKLFDTPTPIFENHDRSHIDSSFKPMKYVLKPSLSSTYEQTTTSAAVDKSIDDDIQKLNQIKQAEKELQKQQEKLQTKTFIEPALRNFASSSSGKITARDVKKGRKIDDVLEMDNSHLKSLANVQPLATMTTGITLKPFSLKSSTSINNNSDKSNTFDIRSTCDTINVPNCSTINNEFSFKFSSPKLVASLSPVAVRPTFQEIGFSSPIQISKSKPVVQSESTTSTTTKSLFDQFKHCIQSTNTWTCPICCIQNDNIDGDKCIACEEPNPNKKSSKDNQLTEETQRPESLNFGDCKKLTQNSSLSSSLPSLNQLFKKDASKNWTCPTCSVSNNIEENRCISCEEPNPHKNKKTSNNQLNNLAKFSFGSVSSDIDTKIVSVDENSSTKTKPSLFDVFKKKQSQDKQQWTCPTCMVPNESNVNRCVSCEEPNPNQPVVSQTKSSTKTSFGFKFGSSNTSFQKDHPSREEGWQCFYCKAMNKSDISGKNVCNECGKIKVMAATKDQVQKFYQTQTFKFGLSTNNTNKDVKAETKFEKQDKTSTDIPTSSSSGGFKFGIPPSSTVSDSLTMTSPFSSSKTTVPFSSSSSSIVKPIVSMRDSKKRQWFYVQCI